MQLTYPIWMNINVMTFIGYGFLKVFLKTNSWGAVGFNFIIAAMACQFAIICNGFWYIVMVTNIWNKIPIDISSLIQGNFGACAGMITMGALIGKVTFP